MVTTMQIRTLYDRFLALLALVAALMMAGLFVIVIYDVTLRTLHLRPPVWTLTVAEYGLFYLTVLASPWLLRQGGHVSVSTFVARLPKRYEILVLRIAHLVAALSCAIIALMSIKTATTIHGFDVRSIAVPRWVILAPIPLGFALLTIEFVRIALTGDFQRGRAEH